MATWLQISQAIYMYIALHRRTSGS